MNLINSPFLYGTAAFVGMFFTHGLGNPDQLATSSKPRNVEPA